MNIFIDTQDMEERYGEQLYQDYLVEQNKNLQQENKQLKERLNNIKEYVEFLSINTEDGFIPFASTIWGEEILDFINEELEEGVK